MKSHRILLGALLFCSNAGQIFALSDSDLPTYFSITEQKCASNNCIDLTTKEQKIGSLRPTPNTTGTFDFFDQKNQRQVILKLLRTIGNSLIFDVYDKNHVSVAKLKMRPYDKFYIYSPDYNTILATSASNAFGTSHAIYDGWSWRIIAKLSRPFFTSSRDTEVEIVNKSLFLYRVDPNILAAVMALYCIHDTKRSQDDVALKVSAPPKFVKDFQIKLKKLAAERTINTEKLIITEADTKAAANLLKQRYQEVYDDANLSEEEKIKQFVTFGCDLIQSHILSPIEEQATLQFLLTRLDLEPT